MITLRWLKTLKVHKYKNNYFVRVKLWSIYVIDVIIISRQFVPGEETILGFETPKI